MKWYDLASISLTIIQAEGISVYILNIKNLKKMFPHIIRNPKQMDVSRGVK